MKPSTEQNFGKKQKELFSLVKPNNFLISRFFFLDSTCLIGGRMVQRGMRVKEGLTKRVLVYCYFRFATCDL